jgi:hypothetical protein
MANAHQAAVERLTPSQALAIGTLTSDITLNECFLWAREASHQSS